MFAGTADVWSRLITVVIKWHLEHDFYFGARNSTVLSTATDAIPKLIPKEDN